MIFQHQRSWIELFLNWCELSRSSPPWAPNHEHPEFGAFLKPSRPHPGRRRSPPASATSDPVRAEQGSLATALRGLVYSVLEKYIL